MAKRPVFMPELNNMKAWNIENIEFQYYPGFSVSQKQKSIESLHKEYLKKYPKGKILEVSSYSTTPLGVQLSAFNLMVSNNGKSYSVESIFQSSKVFEKGGPYKDILYMTSREAKRDSRIRSSGNVIGFKLKDETFPIEPKTYFYNWIYLNVLKFHPEFWEQILSYTAFTDMAFNPQKQYNCQAESLAIFVGLMKKGIFVEAIDNRENFLHYVYHQSNNIHEAKKTELEETSLFDGY